LVTKRRNLENKIIEVIKVNKVAQLIVEYELGESMPSKRRNLEDKIIEVIDDNEVAQLIAEYASEESSESAEIVVKCKEIASTEAFQRMTIGAAATATGAALSAAAVGLREVDTYNLLLPMSLAILKYKNIGSYRRTAPELGIAWLCSSVIQGMRSDTWDISAAVYTVFATAATHALLPAYIANNSDLPVGFTKFAIKARCKSGFMMGILGAIHTRVPLISRGITLDALVLPLMWYFTNIPFKLTGTHQHVLTNRLAVSRAKDVVLISTFLNAALEFITGSPMSSVNFIALNVLADVTWSLYERR
jgi:hypothetical protein